MTIQILLGIFLFTGIVLSLVFIILFARSKLVASGDVTININKEREITVPVGEFPCWWLYTDRMSRVRYQIL